MTKYGKTMKIIGKMKNNEKVWKIMRNNGKQQKNNEKLRKMWSMMKNDANLLKKHLVKQWKQLKTMRKAWNFMNN